MNYNNTHEFALSLLETLYESFFTNGKLDEQRLNVQAPPSQYATTCFSVAAFRAYNRTNDELFYKAGSQTLTHYLESPVDVRSHEEFNSFALLEAIEDSRNSHYELPVSEQTIADNIQYSSSVHTRNGNNWLLLQALCRLKFAYLFDAVDERQRAIDLLEFSKGWQLYDGIVADRPRYRLAPIRTPLTYHAKFCMLYARIAERVSDPALAEQVETNLYALSRVCLPNGECLYFGRSENTVFGYASAIDALSRLDADPNSPDWTTSTMQTIVKFLLSHFDAKQADCQPGHFSKDDRRLDSYIYDAVYASYAAMLLLGRPAISSQTLGPKSPGIGQDHEFLDHAGLLTARGDRSGLGLAVTGQLQPRDSGPDFRYAGLLPHTFVFDGASVCPGVPVETDDTEAAPFLPIVHYDGHHYTPVIWDATVAKDEDILTVRGDGSYYQITSTSKDNQDGDGPQSRLDRLKQRVKHHETSRYLAKHAYQVFKRVSRASKFDIVYWSYNTQPESVSARTRRSVHYLQNDDILVIQTGTVSADNSDVLPSSAVVARPYNSSLDTVYSSQADARRHEVKTHKGPADWYVPDQLSDSRMTWSILILDPSERLKSHETELIDDVLTTNLELRDRTETVKVSVAEPSGTFSTDPRRR